MRFTRLLVVAWCAAVLCASLGGALSLRPAIGQAALSSANMCLYDQKQQDVWSNPDLQTTGTPASNAPLILLTSKPIRIRFFTEDLKDSAKYCTAVGETKPDFEGGTAICTEADILTPEKNDTLLNYLLPTAIALHGQNLRVQPLSNILVPTKTKGSLCDYNKIPDAHHTAGVSDADFVLYVSAGPTTAGIVAVGTTCAYNISGQPLVGSLYISPRYIDKSEASVRYVAHQILHALGFGKFLFDKQGMVTAASIRHKMKAGVVNSRSVVAKAREHYDCSTVINMELEDFNNGTTSSHWKRRNANHDLMSSDTGLGYYSPITIAAMVDTGFYKSNYSKAELLPWGYHAGCALTRNKCVNCGVSVWDRVFCTSSDIEQYKCSGDRLGFGVCSLTKYPSPVSSPFQYFPDIHYSGNKDNVEMDQCPMYEITDDKDTICETNILSGFESRPLSRCLDVSNSNQKYNNKPLNAICAEVYCDDDDASSYKVTFKGVAINVTCTDGKTIDLAGVNSAPLNQGIVKCPPRYEVCRQVGPIVKSAAAGPHTAGSAVLNFIAITSLFALMMLL